MSCFLKQLEHFVYELGMDGSPCVGVSDVFLAHYPISKKVFGFSCSLGKVGSTVFKINSFFFVCVLVFGCMNVGMYTM